MEQMESLATSMPTTDTGQQAFAVLLEMAQSGNPETFIRQNLARFTDEVQAGLTQMLTQDEDDMAQWLYALLQGINQALREQERARLTPQQQAMLREVDALWERKERAGYERRHVLCEQLLSQLSQQETPREWAALHYNSGDACWRLYELTNDHHYAQASQRHYRQALQVYRREDTPSQWAMTQNQLGSLFYRLYERSNQPEQAQLAQQHYQQALQVFRREVAPSQWAMMQHALGNVFSRLYERSNQPEQAQLAQQHYQQALQVYRHEVAPAD